MSVKVTKIEVFDDTEIETSGDIESETSGDIESETSGDTESETSDDTEIETSGDTENVKAEVTFDLPSVGEVTVTVKVPKHGNKYDLLIPLKAQEEAARTLHTSCQELHDMYVEAEEFYRLATKTIPPLGR